MSELFTERRRVLIVKTSSLGDIIHTLPALTDATQAIPGIEFDWIVEESFQNVTRWHRAVKQVFPVALRRWRKNIVKNIMNAEMLASIKAIRQQQYDLIIDAQGLFKSAGLSLLARGKRAGFDRHSAREGLASFLYQKKCAACWTEHAVQRTRILFAQALNYTLPATLPDYDINVSRLPAFHHPKPYYVFLHGTTWDNKHWPEQYWISLAKQLATETKASAGQDVSLLLLWGNEVERARAERIAASVPNAEVLPKMGLEAVASVLAQAKGVVCVDTGLGHLAAALAVPTVSLYGPTDPKRTGTSGRNQIHLAANFPCAPCFSRDCRYTGDKSINPPCFASVSPELVWRTLAKHTGLMEV
jgi:heptosyltransferase-1